MRRFFKIPVLTLPILIAFAIPAYFIFGGSIRASYEIYKAILEIHTYEPNSDFTELKVYGVSTYNNDISSSRVASLYDAASSALYRKSDETKTYLWSDPMGYPRLSSILQKEDYHIEVCAAQNNDNDSVSVTFRDGLFRDREQLDTETLKLVKPAYSLKNVLRN